ncbi:TPA: hypothetical protein DCZ46_01325 [Candidatus Campbellbacteria bacterium]|nr:hypothetical protein [Candidatus Campbellbacteria bacterium]HBC70590.1 hypothetical protein [Candidatus Campbellbacteria bacterium]
MAYSVFRFEAKNFIFYNREDIIMLMKELEKFMSLRRNNFVERMKNATDEDWNLLDEALKIKNYPDNNIVFWALQVIGDRTETDEKLVDTACSILYKVYSDSVVDEVPEKIVSNLIKIYSDKKYEYARFRSACVVYLLGKSESPVRGVIKSEVDFYSALDVIKEFYTKDDSLRDFIENKVLA